MVEEVREVLLLGANSGTRLFRVYESALGKKFGSRTCLIRIRQALIELETWLASQEQIQINLIEGKGKRFSELTFEQKSINVISNGCIFDETIENVRKINGFTAYCLSNWKYVDGSIELENGIGAWVFYGVPKLTEDFAVNDFKPDNLKYVVSNPAFSIHAIGEKSGLNTLHPYRL